MSDPYCPYPMLQHFELGTRVHVSATCAGWRTNFDGTICGGAELVQTVQGKDYWYLVEFDTLQHDLSDDGPYYKAQILGRCLTAAA